MYDSYAHDSLPASVSQVQEGPAVPGAVYNDFDIILTISRAPLSSTPPHTRRAPRSTVYPCWFGADGCLGPIRCCAQFGATGPGCSGVDWSGFAVRDLVKIPPTLNPGKYILGFRYDCEATAQVWSNCKSVVGFGLYPAARARLVNRCWDRLSQTHLHQRECSHHHALLIN